ncbi:hypothetical protein E2C01_009203 [Portunus trituberculatus]|uniref:Uncharacterized protein n=1 Tax=Portunus trituberculatus TaxID=210409 RepID=A0A5B7D403_PORTR|nr:hypothetical protein [Portunus trituberculatus]
MSMEMCHGTEGVNGQNRTKDNKRNMKEKEIRQNFIGGAGQKDSKRSRNNVREVLIQRPRSQTHTTPDL